MDDFKINLSNCQEGHKIDKITLDKFEEGQKIDYEKIECQHFKKKRSETSKIIFFHIYHVIKIYVHYASSSIMQSIIL